MSRQVRRSLANLSRSLSHDEEQALLAETTEQDTVVPKAVIMHQSSVYSLMVFAPPLSRNNTGHYCTLPVLVSCSLFVIALVCQLGLTVIAGQYIRNEIAGFKTSLIGGDIGAAPPSAMTPSDYISAQVRRRIAANLDYYANWHKYLSQDGNEPEQCCAGAECAAMRLTCCDRANVKISSASNRSTESMLFLMPKNAVGESKPVYVGRSWDEMCYRHDGGMLDCAPPSYQYLDAWDELDTNGDGSWSIEEATADSANLGCRFGVSASEMFRSACSGILKDAQDTAANSYSMPIVPSKIEERLAIPRDYFEWWKALVVICVAADMHRCSDLVHSGMFDGAIRMAKEAKVTRGGVGDLDSALDFCQRLLIRNGICDNALPGSYMMYRSRAQDKCGKASYIPHGKYRNPFDERDAMTVTSVNYSMYESYVISATSEFQCFMFLILMVWYVSLLSELKQIIATLDFTYNFKVNGASPFLTPEMEEWVRQNLVGRLHFIGQAILPVEAIKNDAEECEVSHCFTGDLPFQPIGGTFSHAWKDLKSVMVIGSFSASHRKLCFFMCIVRLCLWLYLADVGTSFVIYNRDYSDALINAVELAFILKLPEFLYVLLVPSEVQKKLDGASCQAFPTSLPRKGVMLWLSSTMAWGLIVIPICAGTVVYYNLSFNTMPFLEALECTCYQSGPFCDAARRFERSWWNDYWLRTTDLAKLRSSWLQG